MPDNISSSNNNSVFLSFNNTNDVNDFNNNNSANSSNSMLGGILALIFIIAIGGIMTFLPLAFGINSLVLNSALESRGVQTEATIYKKEIIENRQETEVGKDIIEYDHVIFYEFKDQNQKNYRSNKTIDTSRYETLNIGNTINVVYDPQNPKNVIEEGSNVKSTGGYFAIGFSVISGSIFAFILFKIYQYNKNK